MFYGRRKWDDSAFTSTPEWLFPTAVGLINNKSSTLIDCQKLSKGLAEKKSSAHLNSF